MAAQIGGVSSHAVKKWRYGERVPRPDAMQRLAKATGGKVTADDFMREAA
jgi:transcriptional regulator with XRE-family HTH domain